MFVPAPLNFPPYPFKLKQEADKTYIFDELRKRFLLLTPEEWVRQHLVKFLIEEKNYPRTLIKLEGGLKVNALRKRSDILVFNLRGEKVMLVECKAPAVKITQETFDQVARYNSVHRVHWLVVSNGQQHFCCEVNFGDGSYRFTGAIPAYNADI
jgi:hypothetical protein